MKSKHSEHDGAQFVVTATAPANAANDGAIETNGSVLGEATAPVAPSSAENNAESEASSTAAALDSGSGAVGEIATAKHQSGLWQQFAKIEPAKFQHKSLAAFHMNPCVGCFHGCRFCYVPSVSVNKQAPKLKPLGVKDPDADWGNYGFVRILDEKEFRKSLSKAEATPVNELPADGHRAVMFSTTTDPYQVIKNADPAKSKELTATLHQIVTRSLEIILDESTLNVRILTRGLQAQKHFPLYKKFGKRLMFGVSLPTLNDKLAKVYEPGAPDVRRRLDMLKAAKEAGLHIFVALAPTYPECDEADIRATLKAVAELAPETVFHEPINMRAANVARIQAHADSLGVTLKTEVFVSDQTWAQYSIDQMKMVERLADETGLREHLHPWPDPDLGKKAIVAAQADPGAFTAWLQSSWNRVSEWAGTPARLVNETVPVAQPKTEAVVAEPKAKSKLTLRTPGEILSMEFDDKDLYLQNGIFAKGQSFTLLGPGGLGKSRLALQLAVCTILGKPFVGLPVQSTNLKWLVLQGENSNRRLQVDFKALKNWVGETAWKSVEPNLVVHTLEVPEDTHLGLDDEYVEADLGRIIAATKPDVIAIDPLAGFAAGNLNNDAGMRKTCKALDKLARASGDMPSLVVLHHTLTGRAGAARASGYDRASYGRGSKALNFWTRGQMNFAAVGAESNERLVVSCGKNSNGKEFKPFGIRLDADTHVYEVDEEFDFAAWQGEVTGAATPAAKDKLTPQKIAEFVAEVPRIKKDLVRAIMDETGCEKSTAYNAVAAAEGTTIRRNKEKKFEAVA